MDKSQNYKRESGRTVYNSAQIFEINHVVTVRYPARTDYFKDLFSEASHDRCVVNDKIHKVS